MLQRLSQCDDGQRWVHRSEPDPGETLLDGTRSDTAPGPVAPRDGRGRQPERPAVPRERVEERVAGGVAALAWHAEHATDGGEQDEGGQVEVAGELVQVERRHDLGAQHSLQLVDGERVHEAVVEQGGGVHHRAERELVGNIRENPGERGPVARVAGDQGDLAAEVNQFRDEVGGTRCLRAPAAHEQQVLGTGTGEPPSHVRTERTRSAGDQDGAVRRPGPLRRGVPERGPHQPPGVEAGRADGQLVLGVGTGQHPAQPPPGVLVEPVGQVDEAAPPLRVFGAEHTPEAPQQRVLRVWDRVGRAGGDGTAGRDPQRRVQTGVGEGLREQEGVRQPARNGLVLGTGSPGERHQGEHGRDVSVSDGLAQGAADRRAVGVDSDPEHPRIGGAQRGQAVLHEIRCVVRGRDDHQPRPFRPLPRFGFGGPRPGVAVPPGVEHRGAAGAGAGARVARGGGQPVRAVLERVGGQVGPARAGGAEDSGPVDRDAVGVRLGERQHHPPRVVLVAPEGSERHRAEIAEHLLQAQAQHGVRADLQEDPVAVGEQRHGRRLEVHRVAQVPVPVVAVEPGGVEVAAGEGGAEGHGGRAGGHPVQQVGQFLRE